MGKFNDLTGKRFGNLTVIERVSDYVSPSGYRQSQYLCKYDDGAEKILRRWAIFAAKDTVCPKYKGPRDLTGLKFGRLFVLDKNENNKWRCICDCGTECEVNGAQLRSGGTKSCGCLQRETVSKRVREVRPWEAFKHYDGTSISLICHGGARRDNVTGVKGVIVTQSRKYVASISLRGEYIYLGCYADLLDAKAARKIAERLLYSPLINEYNALHSCSYALEDDGFYDQFASKFPEKFEDLKAKVEKLIFERKSKK